MNHLDIKNIFICKFCLEIYDKPLQLPCGNLICSKHIEKLLSNKLSQSIICCFCDKKHAASFIVDERINKLLELNIHELNLGESYREAIESCQNLESLLRQHEFLNQNPTYFIDSYFNKLKKEIEIKRLDLISAVDTSYKQSLKEIKEFETECHSNPNKDSFNTQTALKSCENKLKEWYRILKMPNFEYEPNWKEIKLDAARETQILNQKLDEAKDCLLLYRSLSIESIDLNDLNNLISFKSVLNENFNKNNSSGLFEYKIENFAKFLTTYEMHYDKNCCIVSNVPWRICAKIEQTEDFNLCLGIFLKCEIDFDDENKRLFDVEAIIRLKRIREVLILNRSATSEYKLSHSYAENETFGISNFILIRSVMDPMNGFYDSENDQIMLEVEITKADEKIIS